MSIRTRLDRKGIREALDRSEELGLVLATDTPPEPALPVLAQAMAQAEEAVDLQSSEMDSLLRGPVIPTPAGLGFLVDSLDKTAWEWLQQLA